LVKNKDFRSYQKLNFMGSIGIVLGMMLAALWRDSIDVDFLTQKHENKINIDVAGVHPPGSQIHNVGLTVMLPKTGSKKQLIFFRKLISVSSTFFSS